MDTNVKIEIPDAKVNGAKAKNEKAVKNEVKEVKEVKKDEKDLNKSNVVLI